MVFRPWRNLLATGATIVSHALKLHVIRAVAKEMGVHESLIVSQSGSALSGIGFADGLYDRQSEPQTIGQRVQFGTRN